MPKPYTPNDKWSQRAAAEGYRARSAYKLMELDHKFGLLGPGMTVVDLGAAPGSWLQVASRMVGPQGRVYGVDLQAIDPVKPNVKTAVLNMNDRDAAAAWLKAEGVERVDAILSDAAPNTSGISDADEGKSLELVESALSMADRFLKKGGWCVIKIFRGSETDPLVQRLRQEWSDARLTTVEASRDRSREGYLVIRK